MHSPDARLTDRLMNRGYFSRPTIAVLFVVLILIASIPVITHKLPPLADYINHLGRTYIINHIGADPDLSRFYIIKWQLVPNLMIDLTMLVLQPFADVYRAGQIFTVMAFILILSGTLAINRALFGYWSPLPLIAAPLLYNQVLLVGVMNYVFGIGLTLWAFAAWIALRDRFWPWRFAVSAAATFALFFCHLYVVGIYGLLVMAFELQRLRSSRMDPLPRRLAEFFAAGLPFLPVAILLAASPTWSSVDSFYWTQWGKLEGLIYVINVYYRPLAYVLLAAVLAALVWAQRAKILHFHPAGWFILALGTAVYLAMPRALFAAHMADQRLPIALAFVIIACFQIDFRDRRVRQGFFVLLFVVLSVRIVEVQIIWDRLGRTSEAFYRSVMQIDRGARVLVVYGDRAAGEDINDFELLHAASIATIERSALVSTTFTVKGKQPLGVRDEFRRYVETEDRMPPPISYFLDAAHADVPYFFTRWPQHFDYVYILFTKHNANPDPRDLRQVVDGPNFQLYRVIKSN